MLVCAVCLCVCICIVLCCLYYMCFVCCVVFICVLYACCPFAPTLLFVYLWNVCVVYTLLNCVSHYVACPVHPVSKCVCVCLCVCTPCTLCISLPLLAVVPPFYIPPF
ncbi:Y protein [human papillomavirus 81]|uniref:Y protein n=1 Tax=human papillomavirus 81 TaxID=333771 RepID=Q705E0_9PAPI|nr:Y protein [human papillomavirus 81]